MTSRKITFIAEDQQKLDRQKFATQESSFNPMFVGGGGGGGRGEFAVLSLSPKTVRGRSLKLGAF